MFYLVRTVPSPTKPAAGHPKPRAAMRDRRRPHPRAAALARRDHDRAAQGRPEQRELAGHGRAPDGMSCASARTYPFHHVSREREIDDGARRRIAPASRRKSTTAEPGVMVTAFLGAKTYGADDVRANAGRIAALMRALPRRDAEACLRRRLHVLGVPRHPRLCAHAGSRQQPHDGASCPAISRLQTSSNGRKCRCRSSSATTTFCPPTSSTTASGCG